MAWNRKDWIRRPGPGGLSPFLLSPDRSGQTVPRGWQTASGGGKSVEEVWWRGRGGNERTLNFISSFYNARRQRKVKFVHIVPP